MYNLVIIGAGASGLFLAANTPVKETLVLEQMEKAGKKILISGSGQCNLTNSDEKEEFITHFGDRSKENFLKPALWNFPPKECFNWFEKRGLPLKTREDGKVFPRSLMAAHVVDLLIRESRTKGVEIQYKSKVLSLIKKKNHFIIKTNRGELKSRAVALTAGGKSFASTGSDGSGILLARELSHKIVDPTQALVPVTTENYPYRELAGNSVKGALMDIFPAASGKKSHSARGDLLFTHNGLSGPLILNNSRDIRSGDTLILSLIPCENRELKREELNKKWSSMGKKQVKRFLKEAGAPERLAALLLKNTGVDSAMTVSQINKKVKKKLITLLLESPFPVVKKASFSGAMATAGGVSLKDINRNTMESRKTENLYFAGEIMDIDGDTGGYNIQAAFSTALLIARALEKKTEL